MAETKRVINDLNVVKITLCNPHMLLTPEMRVRIGQVITSAIDLLKEQEPIEPYVKHDNDYSWYYVCGACHEAIDYKDRFCRHCGRAVKWDDRA